MAIAYDAVGAGNSATSGTTVSTTLTATAGDAIVAFAVYGQTGGISTISAKYSDGSVSNVSMTAIGSPLSIGVAGVACWIAAFKVENVAGGSTTVTFTTSATIAGAKINAAAYSGVGSVSTTLATNTGNSTSLSLSSVASATDHMVVNFFGVAATAPTLSSYTQTSRYNDHGGTWTAGALLGDAAGASTVSFSATSSVSGKWGGVAVDLIPAVAPATATVTITGGTSAITATANNTATPSTATVSGVGGTSTVTGTTNTTAAPSTAAVAVTGGFPDIGGNRTAAPTSATVAVTVGTSAIGQTVAPTSATVAVTVGTSTVARTAIPTTATVTITTGTPAIGQTINPDSALVTITGWTPPALPVSYDSTGAGAAGHGSVLSWSHTIAGNAILVVVDYGATSAVTVTARVGSTPMTQLSPVQIAAVGIANYVGTVFVLLNPPTGTQTVTVTATISVYAGANSVSYFNVGSLGALASTTATGTSMSQTVGVDSSDEKVFQTFCTAGISGAISAYDQTSRWNNPGVSGVSYAMVVGDAPGASSVSFIATNPTSSYEQWAGLAVPLFPTTRTVTPTAASIVTSGGTPAVTGIVVHTTVSPGTATVAITKTTTTTVPAPTQPAITKLAAGQSVNIQIIGDSTAWGQNDTTGTKTNYGWAATLCKGLGDIFDATVIVKLWNYPTISGYRTPVTLRAGSGPTITIQLGGWPGATFSNYNTYFAAMLPLTSCDLVIIQDGFNETSTSFTSSYLTYISSVQARTGYVGAPIVVTTANATTITHESNHAVLFTALFGALTTALLPGKSLPLSPALQASTVVDGVWMLDTQQAGLGPAQLLTDGLHPNDDGYTQQGEWMLDQLAPDYVYVPGPKITVGPTVTPTSATVRITGGTPILGAGALVKLSGNTPRIGLTVAPGAATIHSTGGISLTITGPTLAPASVELLIGGGVASLDTEIRPGLVAVEIIYGTTPVVTSAGRFFAMF